MEAWNINGRKEILISGLDKLRASNVMKGS